MEELKHLVGKYAFLEDVPDFDTLLKKFELSRDWDHLHKKCGGWHSDSAIAENYAKEINDRYGKESARTQRSQEIDTKRWGEKVIISKPTKDEFKDITDLSGNLLPSRK